MNKRLLLNLVLVLAVTGLVALLWLAPDDNAPAPPITSLTADSINRIAIDYPSAPPLRLERNAEQWLITSPVQARAAGNEVKPIIDLASSRPAHSYPASEAQPDNIGLNPPQLTLRLNDIAIALGGSDSLDNNRFVRVGDQIHLISVPIENAPDADYSELVARELLPEDAEITRLELPGINITASGLGGWQIRPENKDKGADAAQFTVDTWSRARALWIKPADTDLDAAGQIVIHTANNGQFKFEVVATQPQLVLRAPDVGVDYHLGANQNAPLLRMEHPETERSEKLKSEPDVELPAGPDASE